MRVREGDRTVLVTALIATAVNADGKGEILGLDVTSSEDGAGGLAFFRGLVAPTPTSPLLGRIPAGQAHRSNSTHSI